VGLAGDELSYDQLSDVFKSTTGSPVGTTFGVLGSLLKWGVAERSMLEWFGDVGYGADIPNLKKEYPQLLTLSDWLKTESNFKIV